MNKKRILLIILVGMMFVVAGCGNQDQSNQDRENFFTDTLGRDITIDATPEKVISLSPAITEILYALDLEEKIIGTTDFCNYPEAANHTPKMGGFDQPNLELIVASEPDLIFIAAGIQVDLTHSLGNLGLTSFSLDAETMDDVLNNILLVGQIMNVEEKAEVLVLDMKNRIQIVKDKVANLEKPQVFFETWDEPLMSAGPGTFIHDLIEIAGGINFAKDASSYYPQISFEVLVDRDPEVYIAVDHQKGDDLSARSGYQSLQAVKNQRFYRIEDDWVTLPGPRIILGLEEIARIIHPEAFE